MCLCAHAYSRGTGSGGGSMVEKEMVVRVWGEELGFDLGRRHVTTHVSCSVTNLDGVEELV